MNEVIINSWKAMLWKKDVSDLMIKDIIWLSYDGQHNICSDWRYLDLVSNFLTND